MQLEELTNVRAHFDILSVNHATPIVPGSRFLVPSSRGVLWPVMEKWIASIENINRAIL